MAFRKIRQIRIEGNVAFVPLTKGHEAVIDAADINLVSGLNWNVMIFRRKDGAIRNVYAASKAPDEDGRMRTVYLHRFILPTPIGIEVDHIDGDGMNNRRSNLRPATRSQNLCNQRIRSDNLSGSKGVSWDGKRLKWVARVGLMGVVLRSRHNTKEDAERARILHAETLHKKFCR